jgi:hypothetical protein
MATRFHLVVLRRVAFWLIMALAWPPFLPVQVAAQQATPTPTSTPASSPAPVGESSESEQPVVTDKPVVYPLAVMVDNFPASRPQTGLAAADVVYEALAEGGITRFLAIYTGADPGLAGPVRSARHYYVYWAAEYNAPVIHVMASDEGYAAFVNTGLPDLDEHRGDPGFLRTNDRPMPYNTYTSPAFDRQILADYGALWPGSLGGLGRRSGGRMKRGAPAASVHVSYPLSDYGVGWVYDEAQQHYLRSQAGLPHIDAATGEQISAASTIVQFVPAWQSEFRGGEWYVDMELTGEGRAVYFQGGRAVEGSWQRPSLGNYTEYRGPDGKLIAFRPGRVWIQIVPSGALEGSLAYG